MEKTAFDITNVTADADDSTVTKVYSGLVRYRESCLFVKRKRRRECSYNPHGVTLVVAVVPLLVVLALLELLA